MVKDSKLDQFCIEKLWRHELGCDSSRPGRPLKESRFYSRSNRKSLNDSAVREMECNELIYHCKGLSIYIHSVDTAMMDP